MGSPLGLLLDDLPVAALISGYAALRNEALLGVTHPDVPAHQLIARMSDMCSGWRAGGSMMVGIAEGGRVPLQDCPPAPDLSGDDVFAWHEMPALTRGALRRRRRIDVSCSGAGGVDTAGKGLVVDAMFRDSYGEPDGNEGVLHEYVLTATVDGATHAIEAVRAEPRVLPAPECPSAAANVARLNGTDVTGLRDSVRSLLTATDSCTHLNDLLRCLADVEWLAGTAGLSQL
jgi:hypothetical protein